MDSTGNPEFTITFSWGNENLPEESNINKTFNPNKRVAVIKLNRKIFNLIESLNKIKQNEMFQKVFSIELAENGYLYFFENEDEKSSWEEVDFVSNSIINYISKMSLYRKSHSFEIDEQNLEKTSSTEDSKEISFMDKVFVKQAKKKTSNKTPLEFFDWIRKYKIGKGERDAVFSNAMANAKDFLSNYEHNFKTAKWLEASGLDSTKIPEINKNILKKNLPSPSMIKILERKFEDYRRDFSDI